MIPHNVTDQEHVANRVHSPDLRRIILCLDAAARDRDGYLISRVAASALESLSKLDDVISALTSPARWNIEHLQRDEAAYIRGENKWMRKPRIGIGFWIDDFPARRGNIELLAYLLEDSVDDISLYSRVKLLRVDEYSSLVDAVASGRDHVDPDSGRSVINAISSLCLYIIKRVEIACEVELGDRPLFEPDPTGTHAFKWSIQSRKEALDAAEEVRVSESRAKEEERLRRLQAAQARDAEQTAAQRAERLQFINDFEDIYGMAPGDFVSYSESFISARIPTSCIAQVLADQCGLKAAVMDVGYVKLLTKTRIALSEGGTSYRAEIGAVERSDMLIGSFGTDKGFQNRKHVPVFKDYASFSNDRKPVV